MSTFANEFSKDEFGQQLADKLIPWFTLIEIISKSKSHEEMLFGTIINERKYWGSKYIQKLSNDLKEYGNGYSYDNLYRIAQFADEFNENEIMEQPVPKIPWGTILIIIKKSKSHEEILYYINETYKNGWSRSMVLNQIAMKSYERSLIEPETTEIIKLDDSLNELGHGFSYKRN